MCGSALTQLNKQAEALRLRIELEAERVQQRKARLDAEQERARAAQAAAQEAELRERSRKLQSGFAAVRWRAPRSSTRHANAPRAGGAACWRAARRAAR